MIYFWGVLAASFALLAEIAAKELGEYFRYWYLFVPVAIGINYSVFRIVQLSPNLISAFIVFSGCTFFGRVVYTLVMQHQISRLTWIAGVLYVGILVLREFGDRIQ